MINIDGKTIKSEKYGIIGTIKPTLGQWKNLSFVYESECINIELKVVLNEKTVDWIDDIAKMMINDYIDKKVKQDELKGLFTGGSEWA